MSVGHHPESSQVSFSPEQLQQLLQLLPTPTQSMSDFNEEAMESPFSGMITCNSVQVAATEWIMDTGATNHMTSNLKLLVNLKPVVANMTVNLPTGAKAMVSHVGDVYLQNGLQLLNVLYVPMFTHNLLSIHKLAQDNKCYAVFSPNSCTIVDTVFHAIKGKGTVVNDLYHMTNTIDNEVSVKPGVHCLTASKIGLSDQFTLWHNRLGHAPVSKLKLIDCIKHCTHEINQVCLTCPMAKFTKLPFAVSDSYAAKAFELIHTDIWGPYKVCTRQRFKYFLTIVDDYTRMTWIYLL